MTSLSIHGSYVVVFVNWKETIHTLQLSISDNTSYHKQSVAFIIFIPCVIFVWCLVYFQWNNRHSLAYQNDLLHLPQSTTTELQFYCNVCFYDEISTDQRSGECTIIALHWRSLKDWVNSLFNSLSKLISKGRQSCASITGLLWRESNGDRWIPPQKTSNKESVSLPWLNHVDIQTHSDLYTKCTCVYIEIRKSPKNYGPGAELETCWQKRMNPVARSVFWFSYWNHLCLALHKCLGQRKYRSGGMHLITFPWPWPKATATLINTNCLSTHWKWKPLIQHSPGHISAMVGAIDVKRKGGISVDAG